MKLIIESFLAFTARGKITPLIIIVAAKKIVALGSFEFHHHSFDSHYMYMADKNARTICIIAYRLEMRDHQALGN